MPRSRLRLGEKTATVMPGAQPLTWGFTSNVSWAASLHLHASLAQHACRPVFERQRPLEQRRRVQAVPVGTRGAAFVYQHRPCSFDSLDCLALGAAECRPQIRGTDRDFCSLGHH